MAGRPLVAWALDAAAASPAIGPVVVAAPPGHKAEIEALAPAGTVVVAGGESRSESVALALRVVDTDLVAVHDAARPLAPAALFDAVLAALADDPRAAGAIAAAPVADTLKRGGAGEPAVIAETVAREGLWAAQTPQAFRAETLRGALDVDVATRASATDDAQLVERAGGRIVLVPADEPNLKVTSPGDLRVAEALLAARA